MQRIADHKTKLIVALMALAGAALVANHFTEWSGEKIKSTCQEDAAATAAAANRDIVEKRVIPQRDARPTLAIWKCPDGKVRTTVIQR
ncbi:hypothetical protein [Pseudomonas chlororaphis]|uniref:hypothetical protein n=1 Tax=Pseudomonas chlororaphis TaxID=587753 RepID=UPI001B3128E4|nr:hypothetical protein [Pseudomonas chlororaphis]MBP5055871.1 hypothetical protein [Pseudomonas chlororaphis]MBP5137492.1 hypothetical protein [Pseudomonas chlororaphis]QTT99229.1 hypothetical protein HUT26_08070 [Pseudomonas chlororaphis]